MKKISQLIQFGVPLAWRNITADKKKAFIALNGIGFALVIMIFQMGMYKGFLKLAWQPIGAMTGDLAIITKGSQYLMGAPPFPERRLHQVGGLPEVKDVFPVKIVNTPWRNPENGDPGIVCFYGVDPDKNPFQQKEIMDKKEILSLPDGVFYDRSSTLDYGDVEKLLTENNPVWSEMNNKRVRVMSLFNAGQSLAVIGSVLASRNTLSRITGDFTNSINLGLIELKDGADPVAAAGKLKLILPEDVTVMTRSEFIGWERNFWDDGMPVGPILLMGMVMAMFVGAVIVYQILYTDINDNLKEYATLKALGVSNSFFVKLVFYQSLILVGGSFLPVLAVCYTLFVFVDNVLGIPTSLTLRNSVIALANGAIMCAIACLFATKKLRKADPAEIF